MSSVSSDVEYLRQQYNKGKNLSNQLVIKYNDEQFQDGDVLKKSYTQDTPKVQVNIETDPQYPYFTIALVDPDAPQRGNERAGPWLHGIQSGFEKDDINNGKTLAEYQGPAPPAGTGPHQYIFLLYKSATGDFSQDGGPIDVNDSGRRKQFQLKKFETDHQLQLVAATSYTVFG